MPVRVQERFDSFRFHYRQDKKKRDMVTKRNGVAVAQQHTQQAAPKHPVCCLNCKNAILHRYGRNPILAACKAKPQPENERFPYEVMVACHLRKCSDWVLEAERKEVELRSKVA